MSVIVERNVPPTFSKPGFNTILQEEAAERTELLRDDNGTAVTSFVSSRGRVIVRRPTSSDYGDEHARFEERVAGLWVARDIPGLEQVLYLSLAEEVVVTQYAGTSIDALSPDTMQLLTIEDWKRVLQAIEAGHEKGIRFDTAGNTVFDPHTRMTLVDFAVAAGSHRLEEPKRIDNTLGVLLPMLTGNTYSYDAQERDAWRGVSRLALEAARQHYPSEESHMVDALFGPVDLG